MKPIARILLASDFSAGADGAAKAAAQLARQLQAAVDIVNVVDTSPLAECYGDVAYRVRRVGEIHAEAQERLRRFADQHFPGYAQLHVHVRDGYTLDEILKAAGELGSDMIVTGTHGRTGVAHLLIGSVAEKVVRASPVPVLTVHSPQ